jgi:hypothetical protein
MHPTGGLHRKGRGKKVSNTAHATRGKRCCADPDKAAVMACVEQLVRDGLAWRREIHNGATALTLLSGEVFHLGKTSVTRIT